MCAKFHTSNFHSPKDKQYTAQYVQLLKIKICNKYVVVTYFVIRNEIEFPMMGISHFELLCATGSSAYIRKLQRVTKYATKILKYGC